MSVCERCTENGNCAWQNHDETICREKPAFPITNSDRIRAMTDEELADFLEALCPSYNWSLSLNGMTWFGFLQQEASE